MKTLLLGALAASTVLGAAVVAAPTEASAQPGYYGRHAYGHRHYGPRPYYGHRAYGYGPRRGYYGPRYGHRYGYRHHRY